MMKVKMGGVTEWKMKEHGVRDVGVRSVGRRDTAPVDEEDYIRL